MQSSNANIINEKKQYIMFNLIMLHPNIWYWENVISSPKELVDFINEVDSDKRSYDAISSWSPWTASDDKNLVYGSVKTINNQYNKINTGDNRLDQKTLYIINSLKMAIEMCSERYILGHKLDVNKYNLDQRMLSIKRWNEGQSMGPHFDGQDGHSDLGFSLVTYLNDDYEGGEIHFKDHNITVKPKAGSLIMFPSQMPFVHEVLPITKGTRYMMPTSVLTLP